MEYIIGYNEFDDYFENNMISEKLYGYWKHFINLLPQHLKQEAKRKGFKLHCRSPDGSTCDFYHDLMFYVPNASDELKRYLKGLCNVVRCKQSKTSLI